MDFIDYGVIFQFVLIILKLTGHITCSWLWIFTPIWLPLFVLAVFFAAIGITEMGK